MVKLNRKLEYAVIALKHMKGKQPGQLTSAKEICDLYGAPFDATARSLQMMTQKHLLKSEQGVQGGYQIVKDLGKVTLYDLIEMILGPVEMAKCFQEGGQCELIGSCNIKSPILNLRTRLMRFYQSISIHDLLEPLPITQPLKQSSVSSASHNASLAFETFANDEILKTPPSSHSETEFV